MPFIVTTYGKRSGHLEWRPHGVHINPSMLLLGMEEFWVYSKLNYADDWIVPESSTDQVRTVAAGGRNLLPGSQSLREHTLVGRTSVLNPERMTLYRLKASMIRASMLCLSVTIYCGTCFTAQENLRIAKWYVTNCCVSLDTATGSLGWCKGLLAAAGLHRCLSHPSNMGLLTSTGVYLHYH